MIFQIDKILRLCKHQSLARSDLPRQIDRMKKLSSDCVKDTTIVQRKFQEWAELTAAIRRACTSADGLKYFVTGVVCA